MIQFLSVFRVAAHVGLERTSGSFVAGGGDRELRDSGCESANLGLGLGSIGASGFPGAPG